MIDAPAVARDVFPRYLDLAPLHGRQRGLVRCIFHDGDDRASLSIDLARALFHCFACGVGGGVKRFAALVGEAPITPMRPPRRAPTFWGEVHRQAVELIRQQPAFRPEVRDLYVIADFVRCAHRACQHDRARATKLGDTDEAWEALERSARVERCAFAVGADIDRLLLGGRLC